MAEAMSVGAHLLDNGTLDSKFTTLCDLFSLLGASLVCEFIFDCLFLCDVIHFVFCDVLQSS